MLQNAMLLQEFKVEGEKVRAKTKCEKYKISMYVYVLKTPEKSIKTFRICDDYGMPWLQ